MMLFHTFVYLAGPGGNVYYPGFKRNFWLEFSSPSPSKAFSPSPTPPAPPRPVFLHPGTNGSVQTVTLGRTTHIDCMVNNLMSHQVKTVENKICVFITQTAICISCYLTLNYIYDSYQGFLDPKAWV